MLFPKLRTYFLKKYSYLINDLSEHENNHTFLLVILSRSLKKKGKIEQFSSMVSPKELSEAKLVAYTAFSKSLLRYLESSTL